MKRYKFIIELGTCWNGETEILEKFISKDIKKGMKKAGKIAQSYINNGTVNDYTSFAIPILITKNKKYTITGRQYNKLINPENIK